MNQIPCPADYICSATPGWVALGLTGGLIVFILILLAVLAVLGRD